MVMNPVDNSPHLRQAAIRSVQAIVGRDRGLIGDAGKRAVRRAAGLAPGEVVKTPESTPPTAEMRRTLAVGRAATAEEPELREDKLAEVRDRLARGYYNSVDVRDKVAGGVDQVIEGMKRL